VAALGFDAARFGYRVEFLPARRGYLGEADPNAHVVRVFVRPEWSDQQLRITLAHEFGHVVDFVTFTAADRALHLATRGLAPGTPWTSCERCTDYSTGAGDWAEVFAYWLAGPGDFRSALAGPPSAAQLDALRPLLAR
jgi:hypothetical protein